MKSAPKHGTIGIPVKAANWVRVFPGEDRAGKPCLYATMGQNARPFFVLLIDIETGRCTKFPADTRNASFPTSALWSASRRCLYIGSAYAGHLHRFSPRTGRVEDLGAINPGKANFPCAMAERPGGGLFIGSHGACDLTSYDPDTGKFRRYGRMDPRDMYFYPLAGSDGTIAGLVRVMKPHVVALDPDTGRHRAMGPSADRDGKEGFVELLQGSDGLLYIKSHEGNFRVSGLEAVPVDAVAEPCGPPALPGGSTWRWLDGDVFEYRKLAITAPGGDERVLSLDWEGDGTDLFLCHAGPDGKIYGSSILPEHFFSFDPATGLVKDHGACSTSGGEAYSMGNHEGKIYIASYPGAKLSVYDPGRPYRFGSDRRANPRELGRPDDVSYRPYSMAAGPAGKVWLASVPDYGTWGGTLAWFDPATEKFGSHRHIIRDCSVVSLAYLEEEKLLLAGFSVDGGTGTRPKARQAGLALWDPQKDREAWQGDLGLEIFSVADLCPAGGGLVYALILSPALETSLVLLDTRGKAVVSRTFLSSPPHGISRNGLFIHEGYLYGFTTAGIYRARLGTTGAAVYWKVPEKFKPGGGRHPLISPGAVASGKLYFGCGHRLLSIPLQERPG